MVRHSVKLNIEILTLYAFSQENWRRPQDEVHGLMDLLGHYLDREVPELMEKGVRLTAIGALEALPEVPRKKLYEAMEKTAQNTSLVLNLALSYGGRAEIVDAARRLARAVSEGRLEPDQIDEELFAQQLSTAALRNLRFSQGRARRHEGGGGNGKRMMVEASGEHLYRAKKSSARRCPTRKAVAGWSR